MKKIISILVLVIFTGLLLVGCSQPAAPEATPAPEGNEEEASVETLGDPIVLKLSLVTAEGSLFDSGPRKFKELIEERSGGNIEVEIYNDGVLGQDTVTMDLMSTGDNLQMAIIGDYMTTIAPEFQALFMPYLFPTRESAYAVLDGELGDQLKQIFEENTGVKVLCFMENGYRHATNNVREINEASDFQGLLMRVPVSPTGIAIFEALGANPTSIDWGELFTALEQGTVDGQENPLSNIYDGRLYEAQKYLSLTRHQYGTIILALSKATWDSMTPEQQALVQETAYDARDFQRQDSIDRESGFLENLKNEGMIVSEPSLDSFEEATKDVYKKVLEGSALEFYEKIKEVTAGMN